MTESWRSRSGRLVRELDEGELADRCQVRAPSGHDADAGSFSVPWSFIDEFEDGLGESRLVSCLDRLVAWNKCYAEGTLAGTEIEDCPLLEFEAQGPAVFG